MVCEMYFSNKDEKDQLRFSHDFERSTLRGMASGISSKAFSEVLRLHADYLLRIGRMGGVKN